MSDKNIFPAYFLQSQDWAKFWLEANLPGHNYHKFEVWDDLKTTQLVLFVYEYPWYFGKKFWYIPKGLAGNWAGSEKDLLIKLFQELWEIIIIKSKSENIVFIKSDWDHQLLENLGIDLSSLCEHLSFGQKLILKQNTKTIQYLETMTLSTQGLTVESQNNLFSISDRPTFSANDLTSFFEANPQWWSQTNQNIRRYTKKSLAEVFGQNQFWQVDTVKSSANFDEFWRVYQLTSSRQDFAIHPQEYIHKLYFNEMSYSILLKDTDGQAQAVWLGISSEDTLTYLYGGNTQVSFDKYGQYLVHLVALKLTKEKELSWYDLGGYDSQKGFGSFKEGYRGIHRVFAGPVDIINNKFYYFVVTTSIVLLKKCRNVLSLVFR